MHTQWRKKTEIYCNIENISWNQFTLSFISENVNFNSFTKFFPKTNDKENCVVSTSQCGNCCELVSHIFGKNFVKLTFFTKEITKESIWRNIFSEEMFRFYTLRTDKLTATKCGRNGNFFSHTFLAKLSWKHYFY